MDAGTIPIAHAGQRESTPPTEGATDLPQSNSNRPRTEHPIPTSLPSRTSTPTNDAQPRSRATSTASGTNHPAGGPQTPPLEKKPARSMPIPRTDRDPLATGASQSPDADAGESSPADIAGKQLHRTRSVNRKTVQIVETPNVAVVWESQIAWPSSSASTAATSTATAASTGASGPTIVRVKQTDESNSDASPQTGSPSASSSPSMQRAKSTEGGSRSRSTSKNSSTAMSGGISSQQQSAQSQQQTNTGIDSSVPEEELEHYQAPNAGNGQRRRSSKDAIAMNRSKAGVMSFIKKAVGRRGDEDTADDSELGESADEIPFPGSKKAPAPSSQPSQTPAVTIKDPPPAASAQGSHSRTSSQESKRRRQTFGTSPFSTFSRENLKLGLMSLTGKSSSVLGSQDIGPPADANPFDKPNATPATENQLEPPNISITSSSASALSVPAPPPAASTAVAGPNAAMLAMASFAASAAIAQDKHRSLVDVTKTETGYVGQVKPRARHASLTTAHAIPGQAAGPNGASSTNISESESSSTNVLQYSSSSSSQQLPGSRHIGRSQRMSQPPSSSQPISPRISMPPPSSSHSSSLHSNDASQPPAPFGSDQAGPVIVRVEKLTRRKTRGESESASSPNSAATTATSSVRITALEESVAALQQQIATLVKVQESLEQSLATERAARIVLEKELQQICEVLAKDAE